MNYQNKSVEETDVRINATTRIWKFATIMMALCIPLVCTAAAWGGAFAALFTSIVPLAVLGAAAFGTAAVWGALGHKQVSAPTPSDLKQLEERMANLEIINRYENALQLEKDVNSRLRAEHMAEQTSYDQEPRKLSIL